MCLQIPRYIDTLHELLSHTPQNHVERRSLDEARRQLEQLSRQMQDEVRTKGPADAGPGTNKMAGICMQDGVRTKWTADAGRGTNKMDGRCRTRYEQNDRQMQNEV